MLKRKFYNLNELGQTLVETLVGAFILTMGISAAVGLAIYAFGSSSNVTKQIVAMGLAREGIEAVKNMRDTNWLKLMKLGGINTDCYDFSTGDPKAKCYKSWLSPNGCQGNGNDKGFCIDPGDTAQGKNYVLSYTTDSTKHIIDTSKKYWNLTIENGTNFGLDIETLTSGSVQYYIPSGSAKGNSAYYRKIIIIKDKSTAPYNVDGDNLALIKVISQVWWTDKKCPASADWPGGGKCSLELQTYLTNWKNYE